jgi:uncharacterized membrane protein
MLLKYAFLWIVSFVGISAVDALWHLGMWGRVYRSDIRRVALVLDGKPVFHNASGLKGIVSCMMGGILGISVYGLVNHWLIRDWSLSMTVLEVIWGPIIGAFAGFFIVWAGKLLKVY